MRCKSCKKRIDEGVYVCPYCGSIAEEDKAKDNVTKVAPAINQNTVDNDEIGQREQILEQNEIRKAQYFANINDIQRPRPVSKKGKE